MEENNKKKRYFCDWCNSEVNENFIVVIPAGILLCFALLFISMCITYNVFVQINSNELNSYSESAYKHLDDIADDVIHEGVGIDVQALPNDVIEYEINGNDKGITFKYYLDNNKDMLFASPAIMTVELSDKYEIISKKSNYSSEEDYIANIKSQLWDKAISVCCVTAVIVMFVILAGLCIAEKISENRKNKDFLQKEA